MKELTHRIDEVFTTEDGEKVRAYPLNEAIPTFIPSDLDAKTFRQYLSEISNPESQDNFGVDSNCGYTLLTVRSESLLSRFEHVVNFWNIFPLNSVNR